MPHEIETLGKGAIPDSPDTRDFKATEVFGVPSPVDWNNPVTWPEPANHNQNGSSSCVAQGWSYYHWQIDFDHSEFCRRDIYSWIYYPGGGAQIRDGGLRILKYGQETQEMSPDPNPETEVAMRNQTGFDPNKEQIHREKDSWIVPNDIDSVAAYIRDYKGVVGGVVGSNPGWQDLVNPRPPASGETTWGHCLYFFGYHMHNGLKCVIAKSSWGTAGGTTVHHIKENYFASGNTFNPWTLIPKGPETMKLVDDGGTVYLVGDLGKIGFADPAALAKFTAIESTIETGSTGNIPQKGIFESGFTLHN